MADRPTMAQLLREDRHAWFFLADAQGLPAALTEAGVNGEHPGLASLVVAYGPSDAPVVRVGWLLRPHRLQLPQQEDDDLTRADLARRLVFTIFETLERDDADRAETVRRINTSPPHWEPAVLAVDGVGHAGWTATAADDRLTYAHLDAQTVFVQTSGWDGDIALNGTLRRPALPEA